MEKIYSMGIEALYPSSSSYTSSSNWTRDENKKFERALAFYDIETPDRWLRIAEMIPGKSEFDVYKQYKELEDDVSDIEAGLVPVPGYLTPSFTVEWVDNRGFNGVSKRSTMVKSYDQERKKGVPWTEDEHRRFLLGLLKHGKGDWRNISRNFVISKTPTQVASHAQKYYNRLNSEVKEKRRPSIHDTTTATLTTPTTTPSQNSTTKVVLDWNEPNKESTVMIFNACNNNNYNRFMPSLLYESGSRGVDNRSYESMVQVEQPRYQFRR